jgi:hypothetical protein
VIRPQRPLPDGQGALQQHPGGIHLPHSLENSSKVVEAPGSGRVARAQRLLSDGQHAFEKRPGGLQIVLVLEKPCEDLEADNSV